MEKEPTINELSTQNYKLMQLLNSFDDAPKPLAENFRGERAVGDWLEVYGDWYRGAQRLVDEIVDGPRPTGLIE